MKIQAYCVKLLLELICYVKPEAHGLWNRKCERKWQFPDHCLNVV